MSDQFQCHTTLLLEKFFLLQLNLLRCNLWPLCLTTSSATTTTPFWLCCLWQEASFKWLQAAIRLPLTSSSRDQTSSGPSSSPHMACTLVELVSIALHWTLFSLSTSLLIWETRNWIQYSMWPHHSDYRVQQLPSACSPCSSWCSLVCILLYSWWEHTACSHSSWHPP